MNDPRPTPDKRPANVTEFDYVVDAALNVMAAQDHSSGRVSYEAVPWACLHGQLDGKEYMICVMPTDMPPLTVHSADQTEDDEGVEEALR